MLIGFVLVPVAANLFKAHMGHTLYNIGWVAGIVGTVIVAVYKGYGFVPDPVFIWTTGNNRLLGSFLAALFVAAALLGLAAGPPGLAQARLPPATDGPLAHRLRGAGRHRADVAEHGPDRRSRHGLRAGRGR